MEKSLWQNMVEAVKKQTQETDEYGYPVKTKEELAQIEKTWNPKEKEELAKVFR
jgi:hypothetical protein